MKIYEVRKTACVAWSPKHQNPVIAVGTMSGALDASFSTNCELEIFDVTTEKKLFGLETTSRCIFINGRFNRISWSAVGEGSMGVIAGGMENGHLTLWNAAALLSKSRRVSYNLVPIKRDF